MQPELDIKQCASRWAEYRVSEDKAHHEVRFGVTSRVKEPKGAETHGTIVWVP